MCSFKICIREKRADDSERAERKNPGIYALLNETMLLFTLPINFYPLICFSQYALFLLVIWYARNRFNKSLYIIEMFVENLRLILQLQKQSLHKIIRQFFFCFWIALVFSSIHKIQKQIHQWMKFFFLSKFQKTCIYFTSKSAKKSDAFPCRKAAEKSLLQPKKNEKKKFLRQTNRELNRAKYQNVF